jgi:hypothetical protein
MPTINHIQATSIASAYTKGYHGRSCGSLQNVTSVTILPFANGAIDFAWLEDENSFRDESEEDKQVSIHVHRTHVFSAINTPLPTFLHYNCVCVCFFEFNTCRIKQEFRDLITELKVRLFPFASCSFLFSM